MPRPSFRRGAFIFHASRVIFALALLACLASISTRLAFSQDPLEKRYRISIGQESAPIRSGTIWLYSYSWYGLQKFKLASIENGLAVVLLDTEKLKREVDPHPNTDAYVL